MFFGTVPGLSSLISSVWSHLSSVGPRVRDGPTRCGVTSGRPVRDRSGERREDGGGNSIRPKGPVGPPRFPGGLASSFSGVSLNSVTPSRHKWSFSRTFQSSLSSWN